MRRTIAILKPILGARPSGRLPRAQGISWKDAILAALIVAVPAGLLSAVSVLAWGCCLWVVGGSILAIVVYHRRAPGFFAGNTSWRAHRRRGRSHRSLQFGQCDRGLADVFARFVLHQGQAIDDLYDEALKQSTALGAGQSRCPGAVE